MWLQLLIYERTPCSLNFILCDFLKNIFKTFDMSNCALGSPVDPLVYIMTAGSSGEGFFKTSELFRLTSDPFDSISSNVLIMKCSCKESKYLFVFSWLITRIVFKCGNWSFSNRIFGSNLSLKKEKNVISNMTGYFSLLGGNSFFF